MYKVRFSPLKLSLSLSLSLPLVLIACDKEESSDSEESTTESSTDGGDGTLPSNESSQGSESGGANSEEEGASETSSGSSSGDDGDSEMSQEEADDSDSQAEDGSAEDSDGKGGEENSEDDAGEEQPQEGCTTIDDPALGGRVKVGDRVPDFESVDSHGETFKFCDYLGDKPVLLDMSTGWCEPCKEFAHYIATGQGSYPPVKAAVDEGRILLIELLAEDAQSNAGFHSNPVPFLMEWHAAYPNPNVIVGYSPDPFTQMWDKSTNPIVKSIGYPSYAMIGLDYKWETRGKESLDAAARK